MDRGHSRQSRRAVAPAGGDATLEVGSRVLATGAHRAERGLVDVGGVAGLVDLDVATACCDDLLDHLPLDPHDVGGELHEVGIDVARRLMGEALGDPVRAHEGDLHRGGGERRAPEVLLEDDVARQLQALPRRPPPGDRRPVRRGPRFHPARRGGGAVDPVTRLGIAALRRVPLRERVEAGDGTPEALLEAPPRELAVSEHREADLLLAREQRRDRLAVGELQLRGADLARLKAELFGLQPPRRGKAPDVVGARRPQALELWRHAHPPQVIRPGAPPV